jgi:hypothetical protein
MTGPIARAGTRSRLAIRGQPYQIGGVEILRYVLPHLIAGCLGGLVAAAGLVATNLGSLRDLILHGQHGWVAGLLLAFGFVLTFGYAAIAHAIGRLAREEE